MLSSQLFRNDARLQAAANNNPPMQKGESGDAVALLQRALLDLGYALPVSTAGTGKPDGIYGKETKLRIGEFQEKAKLKHDGVAGANTLAAMDQLLAGVPDDAVDVLANFRIVGLPEPKNLPKGVTWNPEAYQAAVRYHLTRRLQFSRVARAVIAAMLWKVTIRPAPDATKAEAFWKRADGAIYFTPGVFFPGSLVYIENNWIGTSPDAVLLHEIVHAMRTSVGRAMADQEGTGLIRHPPWTKGDWMSNHLVFGSRGEFNAIVIANSYLSEREPSLPLSGLHRARLLLVKDHYIGSARIPLRNPETFHLTPKVMHYLKMLWREQAGMCEAIAGANAPFNPLRDVPRAI